jgi:D-tyrosyl-tRNA(Tyr) deacylase
MRAVVQRVDRAAVAVEGAEVARIGRGLLVYLGVGKDDTDADIEYLADKIAGLRIFPDEALSMHRSVLETGGAALVVSQFTLHGDVRRGRRPSFDGAMEPAAAADLYEAFATRLATLGVPVSRGVFGAMMKIESVNDGPVTILADSKKLF